MAQKIGFIGLGIMGQRMAANILKAGYEVTVYNRTPDKAKPLAEAGAAVAASPKELAQWADVIVFMLTGPEAIEALLHGDGGALAGMTKDKTVINMSTVSPAFTRKLSEILAAHSITLIDAPVSGSKKPAEDGTLVILAGGPKEAVDAHEKLLLAMGKKVIYCGAVGQGSCMKMFINLLLGIMMEGLCEAVNFGQKCQLDTETMLATVLAGPLGCGLFQLKADMLKSGNYPTQFPLKHMTKDIGFVLDTAKENKAAVPVGEKIFDLYKKGIGDGMGDMDFAVVKKILAGM